MPLHSLKFKFEVQVAALVRAGVSHCCFQMSMLLPDVIVALMCVFCIIACSCFRCHGCFQMSLLLPCMCAR